MNQSERRKTTNLPGDEVFFINNEIGESMSFLFQNHFLQVFHRLTVLNGHRELLTRHVENPTPQFNGAGWIALHCLPWPSVRGVYATKGSVFCLVLASSYITILALLCGGICSSITVLLTRQSPCPRIYSIYPIEHPSPHMSRYPSRSVAKPVARSKRSSHNRSSCSNSSASAAQTTLISRCFLGSRRRHLQAWRVRWLRF
jgi:hypothetical protein